MKKTFTKLFAALALLAFFIPSMMAVADEVTYNFGALASANNWTNATAYTSVVISPITLAANGGGNNGKYYTSDNSWRMYTGGSVSITAAAGYEVTAVSSTPSHTFTISNGAASLSCTANIKFTEIVVTYSTSGGGGGGGSTQTLTFDVSSNPGNWPTANSTTLTDYTYTLNSVDYTFALKNVKCNSGYLMVTSVGVVGLPAISGYKLTKVVASNSSSCSTTTRVGISSSSSSASYISGGAYQTWSTTYTYNLTSTEANTMYYMYVTNKNAQVVGLELTYEQVVTPTVEAPTISPASCSFTGTKQITITPASGTTMYYTTNGNDPDNTGTGYTTAQTINISATTTVKAIAYNGTEASAIVSETYTYLTPLISIILPIVITHMAALSLVQVVVLCWEIL